MGATSAPQIEHFRAAGVFVCDFAAPFTFGVGVDAGLRGFCMRIESFPGWRPPMARHGGTQTFRGSHGSTRQPRIPETNRS